jgi:hypothetical protein
VPGTPTANYGLYIGTVGGDSGAWGGDVNVNLTAYVDGLLGNTLGVAISSSDVTLTLSQWQSNGIFKLTGVLTGNHNLILPFNAATGAGTAVGGKFIVDNETTGPHTITVLTAAASAGTGITSLGAITAGTLYTTGYYPNVALTGGAGTGATANITVSGGGVTGVQIVSPGTSYGVGNTLSASAANIGGTGSGFSIPVATIGGTGVTVPQGSRTSLYSDTISVWYADDSRIAKLNTNAGNPNGSVTGSPGSVNQPADVIWDLTDGILYVSTGGTTWSSVGQTLPTPQGYLTPTSGLPIIIGDVTVAAPNPIFYTPYKGNLIPIYNGTSFAVFAFPELSLALSAGSQLASGIYDVFVFLNGSAVAIAFGPSWLAGAVAGSVTAGSCARGTGSGSTALSRINGILVNANPIIAANNGASTFSIGTNLGTYVGSVFIDVSNGQVSNYLSYSGGAVGGTGGGPARKRGIWNAFNRVPLLMQMGDSFTSGSNTFFSQNTGAGSVWAQFNVVANPTSGNQIISFCGLAEEAVEANYLQTQQLLNGSGPLSAIGINFTTSPSGFYSANFFAEIVVARAVLQPSLGINNFFPIVNSQGNVNQRWWTTAPNMLFTTRYNG